MARTMCFVTLVIAMFAIGCGAAKGKVEGCIGANCDKPEAPPLLSDNDLVILYDCYLTEGSSTYLEWCPGTEEGKYLPRIIMQAAEFSNLEPSGIEPYSKTDKSRNYILIYFFEEDVQKGKVTFIRHQWVKNDESSDAGVDDPKEKMITNEVVIKKNPGENWHKFYRRGFSSLMEESEAESNPSQDENIDAGVDGEDEGESKPKPKPNPVTIFTMEGCPACEKAVEWLTAQKMDFTARDLDADKDASKYLEGKLQMENFPVPILEINGRLLIGWFGGEMVQSVMALPPPDDKSPVDKTYFLMLLNAYRKSKGLQEVAYNDKLDAAASKWAQHHRDENLKSLLHSHKGSTPDKRVKEAGYDYKVVAENLARVVNNNMSSLLLGWKLSPGHNKNLLKKDVTEIGLDCVEAPVGDNFGKYVCVLVLASPKGAKGSKEPKGLKAKITPFEVE